MQNVTFNICKNIKTSSKQLLYKSHLVQYLPTDFNTTQHLKQK